MKKLTVEEIKKAIEDNQKQQEAKNANNELIKTKSTLDNIIELKETYSTQANTKISFLTKIFSSKKYKKLKAEKKFAEDMLEEFEKQISQLELQMSKLNQIIQNNPNKDLIDIPNEVQIDKDGFLSVNGSDRVIAKKSRIDSDFIKDNSENEVIVHCTDFLPKDKTIKCLYDGNRFYYREINLNGVKKDVPYFHHRHTTHFTINASVRATSDGNSWDNKDYVVIAPLKNYVNCFKGYLNQSDSWIYGSLNIIDDAILLVREDKFANLQQNHPEIFKEYTVVKYKGKYSSAIEIFLNTIGYEVYQTDPNIPSHALSIEAKQEDLLNNRDLALNYILNIPYDGKSKIIINFEQLSLMYYLINQQKHKTNLTYVSIPSNDLTSKAEEMGIPKDFFDFWIGCGLVNLGNNTFTFKSDDEVHKDLENFINSSNIKIDLNAIQAIYNRIKNYNFRDKIELEKIQALNENLKIKDLYNFQNFEQASLFFKNIQLLSTNPIKKNMCDYNLNYEKGLILKVIISKSNEKALELLSKYEVVKEISVKDEMQISIVVAPSDVTLKEAIDRINYLVNNLDSTFILNEDQERLGI